MSWRSPILSQKISLRALRSGHLTSRKHSMPCAIAMDCPIKSDEKRKWNYLFNVEGGISFSLVSCTFSHNVAASFISSGLSLHAPNGWKENTTEAKILTNYKMNVFDDKNRFNVSPVGRVHSSTLLNTHPMSALWTMHLPCDILSPTENYFPSF